MTVVAGGVTFSILLATFPALGAVVALYGLVADVSQVPKQLHTLAAVFPAEAIGFLGSEMTRLAQARQGGLSLALAGGLLLSLWSANAAMKAIFVGMNIAYSKKESRSFVRLNLISVAFTVALILFFTGAVAALTLGELADRFLGPPLSTLMKIARWPLLIVGFDAGVAVLYRYAPCRERARWRWISWGSAIATVVWLLASLLFSVYTAKIAHLDRTYGSLGTAFSLIIWIWISTSIVLFGAELNSEIERQTAVDPAAKLD